MLPSARIVRLRLCAATILCVSTLPLSTRVAAQGVPRPHEGLAEAPGYGHWAAAVDSSREIIHAYMEWAGGGYLSTASDLVRYGSSYLEGTLLRPETVALMWTSQRTTSGEETGYGIGWFTGTVDGHREVWHTGGAVGGSTILLIRPDDRVVVAILTNLENARPTRPARDIAGLFVAARRQTGNR